MNTISRVLVSGIVISLVTGTAAGLIGMHFAVPFYFGFFFAFTLAGLITLFVLAAKLSPP